MIFVVATIYSYKSGIFETKNEIIKLENLRLLTKRDSLSINIGNLNKKLDSIENKYFDQKEKLDSLINENSGLLASIKELKLDKEKLINEIKLSKVSKMSRASLKKAVMNFVYDIRDQIIKQEKKISKISDSLRNTGVYDYHRNDEYRKVVDKFNKEYRIQAEQYFIQMKEYLKKLDVTEYELMNLTRAVNTWAVNEVLDALERNAMQL